MVTIDGVIADFAFTTLRPLCKFYNVSYSSASRGKRSWNTKLGLVVIKDITVKRIEGRAKNFKSTKKKTPEGDW